MYAELVWRGIKRRVVVLNGMENSENKVALRLIRFPSILVSLELCFSL
jgi:hypothetical protein